MKVKLYLCLLITVSICVQARAQKKQQTLDDFAIKLSDAILSQDEEQLDILFDADAFLSKVMLPAKNGDLKGFNKGFKESLTKTPLLSRLVANPIANQDGDYEVVRSYFKGKEPHIIFRLTSDQGLNYHDLLLKPLGRKSYKVEDIYIYLSGEYLSETLRRNYLSIAKDYISEEESEGLPKMGMNALNNILMIQNFVREGDYENAEKALNQVSEELRQEKLFQIMNLTIQSNLDNEKYLKALVQYRASFPNDGSANLIAIDYLALNEQFDELLQTINSLDQQIGGDSYLNLYRANALFMGGQIEKAEVLFKQVMQDFPYDIDAPFSLLDLLIQQKRYVESIALVEDACDRFDIAINEMVNIIKAEPTFKEFVASTEFKKWQEGNK